MAQYTKAQLISASNATYFTNTSGGISASAVRDLNDSWISSSVLLSGSNTFIGSQIISGNVDITGTITASLQTGYLFVGNSSGRTQAVATSSIIANTDTGSLLVTASFASTNITFTKGNASQFSLDGFATTGSNTFRGTQTIETGDLVMGNGFRINAPSGNITNLSSATTIQFITEPPAGPGGNNDIKFYNRVSGSGTLFINEQAGAANGVYFEAGNVDFNVAARSGSTGIVTFRSNVVAIDAASTPITASALRTTSGGINSAGALTASLQQGYAWVGNSSGVSSLVATSSFGSTINTGSFATTGSNTFFGPQFISGAYYGDYTSSNYPVALVVSGGIFPYGDNMFDIGSDEHSFNKIVVNGELKGSSLNASSRSRTGTMRFADETFPLTNLESREIIADGSDANTHMYYATSSTDVTALREFAYVPSGSPTTPNMNILSASFASTISGIVAGTGFATLGANTFTGSQIISSAGNTTLFLTASAGFQTNIDFQSENSNFRAFGDFRINNNGDNGGTGSIKMLTKSNFIEYAADQGFRFGVVNAGGNGIEGGYVSINVPSGSQQFQLTGSLVVSNTLTASLAQGYAWVGNSSNISTLVATSSFGGGSTSTGSLLVTASFASNNITFTKGDASTFNLQGFATTGSNSFRGVENIGDISGTGNGEVYLLGRSGSLILGNSVSSPTYAALSHLSSSAANGFTNLIFKTNSSSGDTIISGSGNIFTNPAAVTTGYKRYIGGSNNLYLNNSNGINSQITASATSVSGARPSMVNNIFNGTGNFSINQATNPGTHTYGQNIIGGTGTTTINALGFTGSLNFNSNFNNNGTITINAASASVAEIATGISGSGTVTVNSNGIFGGTITATSPRILLTTNTQTANNNLLAGGVITVTNISSSAGVNTNGNIGAGVFSYTNAGASAIHTSAGAMSTSYGSLTVNAIGSAVSIANSLTLGGVTITNNSFSGSAGIGLMSANRNLFQGQGHTLTVTGSTQAGASLANFSDNTILGKSNTIFSNQTDSGVYNSFNGIVVGGQNLIVSASNSFSLTEAGGAHFGRYNADDGRRNKTGENVFSVGTGNSTTRKTGFLIDSGSNSYFEGTLNVSGSTAFTGSLAVSSFTTLASVSSSLNFADDTAAAAGGVPLGGLYRNGNFVMIRLT